ncbi:MAG: deoxyribonuclease IV [Candidatus Brockarchaeota archaeon]|nr:deoxyribonuclease IV [Candidatus Brockarchaeota archaeon]
MKFGVHVSISGSIDLAVDRAVSRRCDTFQMFTRSPRRWDFADLEKSAEAFRKKVASSGLWPVVVHMPYLPNLASPRREVFKASVDSLVAEVERCRLLKVPYLVTHLGSHLGSGFEAGRERVVQAVSEAASRSKNAVSILLENTAGSKNSIGSTFEEISLILERVDKTVNVCFDTCHAFASGYDMRDGSAVGETLDKFDGLIGLARLKLVHVNDSKGSLGSGLDRHEHVGLGKIGRRGFRNFLTNPKLREIPMILETPIDVRRNDFGNLEAARRLARPF